MNIEQWEIDRVKPYENNPRKNEKAIDMVAESLRAFGWRQPIVVDSNGIIIVGHTRWMAAKKIGMTTVPVTIAGDLDDDKVRAYRIADNRTNEIAEWDMSALQKELDEISIDMSAFMLDDLFDNKLVDNQAVDEFSETYEVVVECLCEGDQKKVFDFAQKEGMTCRILTL